MTTLPAPVAPVTGSALPFATPNSWYAALDFLLGIGANVVPRFRATASVTQSIPDSTDTALTWDTEQWDTAGGHASGSRFTVPYAGVYEVSAVCPWAASTAGVRYIKVAVSGTAVPGSWTGGPVSSTSAITRSHIHDEVLCAAGDYIEILVQQTSGSALGTNAGATDRPRVSIRWVP